MSATGRWALVTGRLLLLILGPYATTRPFIREVLDLHRLTPVSSHLEVETYTWGVLPPEHRGTDMVTEIARELQWVRQFLKA